MYAVMNMEAGLTSVGAGCVGHGLRMRAGHGCAAQAQAVD